MDEDWVTAYYRRHEGPEPVIIECMIGEWLELSRRRDRVIREKLSVTIDPEFGGGEPGNALASSEFGGVWDALG